LVENALKHGIAPREEGGELTIRSRREGGELVLEVLDSGTGPGAAGHGVGLANLRARLDLAYGRRASFALGREGAWTAARIRLNLSALNDAHDDLANPGGG
jgi:LytS/YehU family sensor histidine kinase